MCKAKMEATYPTFRVMEVVVGKDVVIVDFNAFEIKGKNNFKVGVVGQKETVCFSRIKPKNDEDKAYLEFVSKEYGLIAVKQIKAQKSAEKKLSKTRRVA